MIETPLHYPFYFLIITVSLLSLTWQDYFNNMKVDSRRIYLMSGLTAFFIYLNYSTFWHLLLMILFSIIVSLSFGHALKLASADQQVLTVLFMGFTTYSFKMGVFYSAVLVTVSLLNKVRQWAFNKKVPSPYFGVIALSWAIVHLLVFYL